MVRVELLQEQGNYVKRTVETLRRDVVAAMTVAYWTSESWSNCKRSMNMFTLAKAGQFYFLPMGQVPFRSVRPSKNPMVPQAKKLELLPDVRTCSVRLPEHQPKRNQRLPIALELLQQLNGETSHEVLYKYFGNKKAIKVRDRPIFLTVFKILTPLGFGWVACVPLGFQRNKKSYTSLLIVFAL